MKKLVIFLIRYRFGLKEGERFQFTNQKSNDIYYFTDVSLMKIKHVDGCKTELSGVSLNWLLDDQCEIRRV